MARERTRRAARRPAAALAIVCLAAAGCGGERRTPEARVPVALPVLVLADSTGMRLRVEPPPRARVVLARVEPRRAGLADLALPEARPDSAIPEPPAAAAREEDLQPPILKSSVPLVVPPGPPRSAVVHLDIRIDPLGEVTDALWAGGAEDPALVAAATECALAMRFYPALRGGLPVEVWCRQEFQFGR